MWPMFFYTKMHIFLRPFLQLDFFRAGKMIHFLSNKTALRACLYFITLLTSWTKDIVHKQFMKFVKQWVAVHEVNRPSLCPSFSDCNRKFTPKTIVALGGICQCVTITTWYGEGFTQQAKGFWRVEWPLFSSTQVGIVSYFIGAGIRLEMSSSESS